MRLIFLIVGLFLSLCLSAQKVIAISIDGTINPSSSAFIAKGIAKAEKENAQCLLIRLNTPGGLLKSTRVIISDMLASPVPVIVYVSPEGAHAGSAGVFITMAAHFAAMAPGTNIGAAHPVSGQQMDTVLNAKATNDAAAFIRTIAEKRGRNATWAEEAVRSSVSITATEALNKKVIDTIAISIQQLLEMADGKTIVLAHKTQILQTRNATVEEMEMGFMAKLLDIISDPNIAYILMMLGFYGLLFELYNPGAIFPGVIGVIALVLALYAFHTLPVNYAGFALIVFALIMFLLEIKVTSHGILTIGGIVSLILGSFMLIRDDVSLPFFQISKTVIISTAALTALFFLFVIGAGIRAQRFKPAIGPESFIGEKGEVLIDLSPTGTVLLHGEIWSAESVSGPVEKGQKVQVRAMKNFKLYVEKL